MKTFRRPLFRSGLLVFTLAAALQLKAQTIVGDTIANTLYVTNNIDMNGTTFTQGAVTISSTNDYRLKILSDANIVHFEQRRAIAGEWIWEYNNGTTVVPSAKLDATNKLILYTAGTAGVTLDPAAKSLTLGTATLTNTSGTLLTANGAFTANGNMNFTGTDGSLALSASGVALSAVGGNKNVTLNSSGTGDLVFNANGVERVRIKSSGDVGVGTANPGYKFQVAGDIGANGNISLINANSQIGFTRNNGTPNVGGVGWHTDGYFYLGGHPNYGTGAGSDVRLRGFGANLLLGTAGADVVNINSVGNVGIGTSPNAKLHVNAGVNTGLIVNTTNQGPWGIIMQNLSATGSGLRVFQADGGFVTFYNNYPSGANITLNQNDGNFGIGTTSPQTGTHLFQKTSGWPNSSGANQTYGVLRIQPTDTGGVLDFGVNSGSGAWLQVTHASDLSQKYPLLFNPNGGNVGIGTISPSGKLDIVVGLKQEITTYVPISSTGISDFTTGGVGWVFSRPNDGAFAHALYTYNSSSGAKNNLAISSRSDIVLATGNGPEGAPERLRVSENGNVGIGTTTPSHKLSVNGTIRAKEVIVDTGWADYVFDESYRLAPLSEVESHIKAKRHLPGIPSAAEVAEHGVSMGDMQSKLLSKVEELTLYMIELKKENAELQREMAELRAASTRP